MKADKLAGAVCPCTQTMEEGLLMIVVGTVEAAYFDGSAASAAEELDRG